MILSAVPKNTRVETHNFKQELSRILQLSYFLTSAKFKPLNLMHFSHEMMMITIIFHKSFLRVF